MSLALNNWALVNCMEDQACPGKVWLKQLKACLVYVFRFPYTIQKLLPVLLQLHDMLNKAINEQDMVGAYCIFSKRCMWGNTVFKLYSRMSILYILVSAWGYLMSTAYWHFLLITLGKFSRCQIDILLLFSKKIGFDISCKVSPAKC